MVKMVQDLVRPYVTVVFATAIVVGWLQDKVSAEAFLGLVGIVIGFWFQQRQQEKPIPPAIDPAP